MCASNFWMPLPPTEHLPKAVPTPPPWGHHQKKSEKCISKSAFMFFQIIHPYFLCEKSYRGAYEFNKSKNGTHL